MTVAEGARVLRDDGSCWLLQWGRNLTVAEGQSASAIIRSNSLLQWGRNLTVAEGCPKRRESKCASGLQWGRNLTVAEGGALYFLCHRHARASMGPQLDSCGRAFLVLAVRPLLLASMGPQLDSCGRRSATRRPVSTSRQLQWGRNLTVAEGGKWSFQSTGSCGASMGPQLDSCGRLLLAGVFARHDQASMGPQLDSCGRTSPRHSASAALVSFNGAAT